MPRRPPTFAPCELHCERRCHKVPSLMQLNCALLARVHMPGKAVWGTIVHGSGQCNSVQLDNGLHSRDSPPMTSKLRLRGRSQLRRPVRVEGIRGASERAWTRKTSIQVPFSPCCHHGQLYDARFAKLRGRIRAGSRNGDPETGIQMQQNFIYYVSGDLFGSMADFARTKPTAVVLALDD